VVTVTDMAITATIIRRIIIMIVMAGTVTIMAGEVVTGDESNRVTSVSGYRLPCPLSPFWEQEMEGWRVSQGR
jgi:hypothetical protein